MAKKPNGNGKGDETPDPATAAPPAADPAAAVAGEAQPDPAAGGDGENPSNNGANPSIQPPSDGENGIGDNPVTYSAQPEKPAAPRKPRGPGLGDPVLFALGDGERPINGRRQFPAIVTHIHEDGSLDLSVDYGQTAGFGNRRNVREGAEPGCWAKARG